MSKAKKRAQRRGQQLDLFAVKGGRAPLDEPGYVDGSKRDQLDGTDTKILRQKLADEWRVGDQRSFGERPFLLQIETPFVSQLLGWRCRSQGRFSNYSLAKQQIQEPLQSRWIASLRTPIPRLGS